MIKIVDFSQSLSGINLKTNLLFGNNMVFIESSDFLSDHSQPISYRSIRRANYLTQEVDKFNFDRPVDLISFISSGAIIYYGYIEELSESYRINIKKVDCISWKEENIITVDIQTIENENSDYCTSILRDSVLIGLSDRYAVLAVPRLEIEKGQPFFARLLLIDSLEKKSYSIQDNIEKTDTLLRMDEARIVNCDSETYILFKTGRIRPFEKRRIWEEQTKKGVHAEYHDHIETLLVTTVDDFIKSIKCGHNLNEKQVVQRNNLSGALSLVETDKGKLVYLSQSFIDRTSDLCFYDLKSRKTTAIKDNKLYDKLSYFNGKVFGYEMSLDENRCIEVFDIVTKAKTYTSVEEIAYIDNDNVVTLKLLTKGNILLSVRCLSNGRVTNTYEGRYYGYVSERNILVLF